MADRITYVGLDVHKESIVAAVAAGGLRGEVREYGRIANTSAALTRLLGKLGGDGVRLRFCYEAGPCGYGIQRQLSAQGHECVVVAPSLIPRRAGVENLVVSRGTDGSNPVLSSDKSGANSSQSGSGPMSGVWGESVTGTTDGTHMRHNLDIFDFPLTRDETGTLLAGIKKICRTCSSN
jgi:hypothetical protein